MVWDDIECIQRWKGDVGNSSVHGGDIENFGIKEGDIGIPYRNGYVIGNFFINGGEIMEFSLNMEVTL